MDKQYSECSNCRTQKCPPVDVCKTCGVLTTIVTLRGISESDDGERMACDRMTPRDEFAAAALTGIVASYTGDLPLPETDFAADNAYHYADAMMRRRERK